MYSSFAISILCFNRNSDDNDFKLVRYHVDSRLTELNPSLSVSDNTVYQLPENTDRKSRANNTFEV